MCILHLPQTSDMCILHTSPHGAPLEGAPSRVDEGIRAMSKKTKSTNGWRVVYGETRPMWEQVFGTKREADAFAKKHRSFGDVIFSIAKVVPGEPPQSITAALIKRGLLPATPESV